MTIPETLLTFVGAPAGIIAVITLAVLGPGQLRAPARYRPGRPWDHEPAWFVPNPGAVDPGAAATHGAIDGHSAPALTGAKVAPAGGASGEW